VVVADDHVKIKIGTETKADVEEIEVVTVAGSAKISAKDAEDDNNKINNLA
jgi:hypothetical protein